MKLLVYDSGIGGQVVYELLKDDAVFAQQHTVSYFSDHANFPYGTKNEEELFEIILGNFQKFKGEGVDLIVVACNTASIVIDKHANKFQEFQFLTIIQPTVEAMLRCGKKSFVILGSEFTIGSHIYSNLLKEKDPSLNVMERAEQHLIQLIETKQEEQVRTEIGNVMQRVPTDVESLVLACTHYSLYKKEFETHSHIIDSSQELFLAVRAVVGTTTG